MQWRSFWDSYKVAIHDNNSLCEVEKFNYLRSYLAGEAKRSIEGISVTNANYSIAIDTIEERFGNSDAAVFAHLDKLFCLEPTTNNTAKLRHTYDECEKHIRSLSVLGLVESTYGKIFAPLILSKLPQQLRLEFNRKHERDARNLENLRKFMRAEIEAREEAERSCGNSENKSVVQQRPSNFRPQNNTVNRGFPRFHQTTEALVMSDRPSTKICVYCNGEHYSDECRKICNVAARKEAVKGRCFVCLKNNHSAMLCRSPRLCVYCKRKHHRSLCPEEPWKKNQLHGLAVGRENHSENKTVQLSVNASNENEIQHENVSAMLGPNQQVLLQFITAEIASSDGSIIQTRGVLDTGSHHSYITDELMKKLKETPDMYEFLSVGNFGSEKHQTKRYPLVTLKIRLPDGTVTKIRANVVPSISTPIEKISLNPKKYEILTTVKLADHMLDMAESVKIDLLLCNDYYYEFVGPNRLEIGEGLVLLQAKFGWVPAGRVEQMDPTSVENGAASLLTIGKPVTAQTQDAMIARFWSLEDIGIKENAQLSDDDFALQKFNVTIKCVNGRYQVNLPWREENPELPENYELAAGCLRSLTKCLEKTPEILHQYEATIKEQIECGVVERVDAETPTGQLKHYIPTIWSLK